MALEHQISKGKKKKPKGSEVWKDPFGFQMTSHFQACCIAVRQNEVFIFLLSDGPKRHYGLMGQMENGTVSLVDWGRLGQGLFAPARGKGRLITVGPNSGLGPAYRYKVVVSWAFRGLRRSPRNFSFQENNGNLLSLMKLEMQKRSFTLSLW